MNIIYTGSPKEFPPQYREKLDAKLQKIGKMVERKGEKEAHVIHRSERFRHQVEITINMFDHQLVCTGEDGDLQAAITGALDKLEKQVVKMREKWRDTHRHNAPRDADVTGQSTTPREPAIKAGKHIYRVDHESDGRKPMTLEEAVLEFDAPSRNGSPDYFVYRDAGTDRISVLLRRRDGHFDLIES